MSTADLSWTKIRYLIGEAGTQVLYSSRLSGPIESVIGPELRERLILFFRLGYWPDVRNPKSFNEKVINRKLFTNKSIFTDISDKHAVREYVREKVGEEVLNELYYSTEDPSSIPFEDLPESLVIKPTHSSGSIIITGPEDERDNEVIIQTCNEWLSEEFGEKNKEYWYKSITPKIIVEKKLEGHKSGIPIDYKFFVFNGKVHYVQVDLDRFGDHTRCLYDTDWNLLPYSLWYPRGDGIDQPKNFAEMKEVAEQLGDEFDFARVDLFQTKERGTIFGEITLAPGSGYEKFTPTRADFEMGTAWDIRNE